MSTRDEQIHSKGFDIIGGIRDGGFRDEAGNFLKYGNIKIQNKKFENATIDMGSTYQKAHPQFGNKFFVLKAIREKNLPLLREISQYYYDTSGIYSRACDYLAYLYRYDWYIVPEVSDDTIKPETVLKDFDSILRYLDNSHVKKFCGEVALEVILKGAYYGYIIPSKTCLTIQQLPADYCRCVMNSGSTPIVEFNMRFFDDYFKDPNYRVKVLKMFPKEFQEGYRKFKTGKLQPDYYIPQNRKYPGPVNTMAESRYLPGSWFPLTPGSTVRFAFPQSEKPFFINAIPAILDLDQAQDVDRKKQLQRLTKVLIQKLPLDKNGDLIFDVDEARDIHLNARDMVAGIEGLDVLTTFADVSVENLADTNASTATDDLERVERSVFNQFAIAKNIFNSDSNLSVQYSINDDESTMRNLLLQFNTFFDSVVKSLGRNKKKYSYRLYMLETTQYNYKDLSKMYKEQVQIGYSKMLPQIAMGHSQSSIIHAAMFENEILHLSEIMLPPLMSSTMNPEALLGNKGQSNKDNSQNTSNGSKSSSGKQLNLEEKKSGRPEKDDTQKSEKTIANRESM